MISVGVVLRRDARPGGRKILLNGCGACPLLVGPSARSHMVGEREHDPLAQRPRESEW